MPDGGCLPLLQRRKCPSQASAEAMKKERSVVFTNHRVTKVRGRILNLIHRPHVPGTTPRLTQIVLLCGPN